MIIVEEKRPQEQINSQMDSWTDWKPEWTGKQRTPQDIQEKHSPTERRDGESQRRIVDARLWGSMTALQQEAAIEIAASFEMIGRGMGYVSSDWQRIPGCRGPSNIAEAHARMMNHYMEWAKKCAARKISHAMVVDVLCFCFTCRTIDRDRRLKNGSTRENLMRGLSLYCTLRGWN